MGLFECAVCSVRRRHNKLKMQFYGMLHVEIPKRQIDRRELTSLTLGASNRRPALLSVHILLVLSISSPASAINGALPPVPSSPCPH
jgi:hypothetical protein